MIINFLNVDPETSAKTSLVANAVGHQRMTSNDSYNTL